MNEGYMKNYDKLINEDKLKMKKISKIKNKLKREPQK